MIKKKPAVEIAVKRTPLKALRATAKAFIKDFENTSVNDLQELAYNAQGAPVLIAILEMCQGKDADRMITGLFGLGASPDSAMLYDSVGSHVADKAIECASDPLFLQIFNELFRGQLQEHSSHGCANFAVQRVLG